MPKISTQDEFTYPLVKVWPKDNNELYPEQKFSGGLRVRAIDIAEVEVGARCDAVMRVSRELLSSRNERPTTRLCCPFRHRS